MQKEIKNIIIVGGGTAGWMSAALMAKRFAQTHKITVIESEQIGTVGVGEATIPGIRDLNAILGFDENEFMRETQATIKLGIEFNNWNYQDSSYMHGFGNLGYNLAGVSFHHYWLRYLANGGKNDIWAYAPSVRAAYSHKFERIETFHKSPIEGPTQAFHFDAGLYAKYLRKFAESLGVVRQEGIIASVQKHGETGFLIGVKLQTGEVFEGDFFVDCSGFRSLLLGQELGVAYQDWSKWLPCDRAIAIPCARGNERLLPYTKATAHSAGWQWRIPLQHRTGNGHVYSSSFMDDDEGLDILLANLDNRPTAEPNKIRFTTGRREKFWHKNCVAIGLSGGFLEPLESTSIHLIQNHIGKLLQFFPQKDISQSLQDEYNRQAAQEFELIRDFLIVHYYVTERDDSQFWKYCRNMEIPDTLRAKLDLFVEAGRFYTSYEDLFRPASWLQVMLGQGLMPKQYHPMADQISENQLKEALANIEKIINRGVAMMSSHEEFIEKNCQANVM